MSNQTLCVKLPRWLSSIHESIQTSLYRHVFKKTPPPPFVTHATLLLLCIVRVRFDEYGGDGLLQD